ncbi:uncharacterized protein M437DRAFT_57779 [Aureobasidium melanogenum CBS 110374]|uniref:Uncharacterized protein n=1 Tax=Aureobasidium melanogenum (strain CBS 110374) TaxID=1043003 RepID=A0A074VEY0_AURM1|nr:uncharacterized protein M437DRAFT_57779 [Aureobasidium melanogenum CBS 110374]KEQ58978.1 hypothetical protein M437DRAFT_57779 [Aureobasidium melanogenum CBS 110374]
MNFSILHYCSSTLRYHTCGPSFLRQDVKMLVTIRQRARSQLRSRNEQQNAPFNKAPREVRDMIYDPVFSDDSEVRLPHPLMRVSRALREETTEAFARNVGPRATFYMACITHHRRHRTGPVITIQGTNNTSILLPETRSVKAKSRRDAKSPYQPWKSFRRSELGMQMVPRVRHLILEIKMGDWIEIDIIFRDGAAPEFSVKAGWSSSNIGLQALCMCLRKVNK